MRLRNSTMDPVIWSESAARRPLNAQIAVKALDFEKLSGLLLQTSHDLMSVKSEFVGLLAVSKTATLVAGAPFHGVLTID